MMRWGRLVGAAALALGLAACSGTVAPPARNRPAQQPLPVHPAPKPPTPAPSASPAPTATAFTTGWVAGPPISTLPIDAGQAARVRNRMQRRGQQGERGERSEQHGVLDEIRARARENHEVCRKGTAGAKKRASDAEATTNVTHA